MQITIREPGSAITHFIGMMMAIIATAPLLVKAAMEPGAASLASLAVFMLSMILLYGASATYHSVNFSERVIKIFHGGHRVIYAGMHDHPWRKARLYSAGRCLGNSHFRNVDQSFLDHLSQMVFFYYLYRHGMGVCGRLRTSMAHTSCQRLLVAACGGDHLYDWRHHLCSEASPFQFTACPFRFS